MILWSPDNAIGGDAVGANSANQVDANQQTETDGEKKQASDDAQPPETVKREEGETSDISLGVVVLMWGKLPCL